MQEIFVPALGMASESVHLTEWLKKPGDTVAVGDVLASIETDKAELEIESTAAGVLGEHRFASGSDVPSGATIVVVLAPGETEPGNAAPAPAAPVANDAAPAPAPVAAAPAPAPAPTPAAATPQTPAAAPAPAAAETVPAAAARPAGAGPRSRSERNRDAQTGELEPYALSPRERSAAAAETPAPVATAATSVVSTSTDRHRAAVANAVSRSWAEIPHFAVQRELRMETAVGVQKAIRVLDSRVTLTDVILKAYALSLMERVGTRSIDLGLAVATERGVSIPVLRDVATADLMQIAEARRAAVERAVQARLSADDAVVAHSTVSNLGAYGVDSFTAIVPSGQTSILSVGASAQRPVVIDGELAIATTMIATLNVDHRTWDGQHAAEVLQRLAAVLEQPMLLGAVTR